MNTAYKLIDEYEDSQINNYMKEALRAEITHRNLKNRGTL
jgi:hypothetical protein